MGRVLAREFLERFRLAHPVVQAGMGGGAAGGELAGAVSAAGGLGTVGMLAPGDLAAAIRRAQSLAAGRTIAANLLVPFTRRAHVEVCADLEVPLVVLHGGRAAAWIRRLRERDVTVLVTVGTREEARRALLDGADGLVVQGVEAGGHLLGVTPLQQALPDILEVADGSPVLAAGGVADARDVRRVLDAGATAAVAGTRFLLTEEAGAHPAYKQRVVAASETFTTLLFGLGWPLVHRVIANEATRRWCRDGEPAPAWMRLLGRASAPLSRTTPLGALGALAALQRPAVPLFTPALPLAGMPERVVRSSALYAGETVARLRDVIPAARAVEQLSAGA
jgi:NAD(P)H-dependent flavin oxidoreductase YrpB (nitropropane dioxygenase family)